LDLYIPAADTLSSSASAWLSSLSAATKAEDRIEDMFLAEVLTAVEARVQGTWDVLSDLGQFDNRSVVPVLKIARRSILPYEHLRDWALRVLLDRDDSESYSDLVRSGSSVRKSYEFRAYIEAVYYTRSSSPAVIAGLRSVFDSPEMPIELRYAAASALAEIHTKPLLPLFEKWLFDSDPILRAYGAAGVGLFANGCGVSKKGHNGCFRDAEAPRPAYWVPELHEKQMNGFRASKHNVASAAPWVAFWQDWWKKNSIFVLNDPRPR
jgi:hypothetical protein